MFLCNLGLLADGSVILVRCDDDGRGPGIQQFAQLDSLKGASCLIKLIQTETTLALGGIWVTQDYI